MSLKKEFKPVGKDTNATCAADSGRASRESRSSLTKFGGNILTAGRPPKIWATNTIAAENGFYSD